MDVNNPLYDEKIMHHLLTDPSVYSELKIGDKVKVLSTSESKFLDASIDSIIANDSIVINYNNNKIPIPWKGRCVVRKNLDNMINAKANPVAASTGGSNPIPVSTGGSNPIPVSTGGSNPIPVSNPAPFSTSKSNPASIADKSKPQGAGNYIFTLTIENVTARAIMGIDSSNTVTALNSYEVEKDRAVYSNALLYERSGDLKKYRNPKVKVYDKNNFIIEKPGMAFYALTMALHNVIKSPYVIVSDDDGKLKIFEKTAQEVTKPFTVTIEKLNDNGIVNNADIQNKQKHPARTGYYVSNQSELGENKLKIMTIPLDAGSIAYDPDDKNINYLNYLHIKLCDPSNTTYFNEWDTAEARYTNPNLEVCINKKKCLSDINQCVAIPNYYNYDGSEYKDWNLPMEYIPGVGELGNYGASYVTEDPAKLCSLKYNFNNSDVKGHTLIKPDGSEIKC
jgi:hypothetical protein